MVSAPMEILGRRLDGGGALGHAGNNREPGAQALAVDGQDVHQLAGRVRGETVGGGHERQLYTATPRE